MSEWTAQPLDQLADISSGGTPSRTNMSFWDGGIPWVTPSDITASETNYIFDTNETITEDGLASSSAKLLPAGALLLTSRATIGEIRIAARPMATNQGFKNVIPKPGIDGKFLFYQLSRLKSHFERYAAGSTFLEINRKDTGRVTVPLPKEKQEQEQIGRILQTIDRATEKTEALIEKYQQIKAGLMHDLFTRGIGPDGQLRPPREQAPELYQETPIGWIPKQWDFVVLEDLYAESARNGLYKPAQFHGRGVKMVNMGDIFDSVYVDIDNSSRVDVTRQELAVYGLREGDILFGRRSLVMEGAGKSALVENLPGPATFESSIIRVSLNNEVISSYFAAFFLSSEIAYRNRRRFIRQVAVSGVSGSDVKQFRMIVPPIGEQEEIVDRIKSIDERLSLEKSKAQKLREKKYGLMHDLLTGKVSVQLESEPETEPEAAHV